MKAIILFLFVSFIPSIRAEAKTLVNCAHPSTRFHFYENNESGYTLEIVSPYGAKFTPFYEGSIAAVGVAELAAKEQLVRTFPNLVTFKFEASQCVMKSAMIECEGGSGEFGRLARFYSELRKVQTLSFEYTKFYLHLNFLSEGKRLSLVGDYVPENCFVSGTF